MLEAETKDTLEAGGDASVPKRSIDWAATPLGPVRAWSPTLRAMDRIDASREAPDQREQRQSEPEPTPPERQKRAGDPWRVLVVDDDHDVAVLLDEALVELGYSVEVADVGASALQVARTFCPDTALVDVGLPDMDGFELGRRLRDAEDVRGTLWLVAITGYGRESDRVRSREAGFDLHLVEPVGLNELDGAVVGVGGRAETRSGQGLGVTIDHHGG